MKFRDDWLTGGADRPQPELEPQPAPPTWAGMAQQAQNPAVPASPAPPTYGPPPGYPYQPVMVQLPPTSGMAVASLVFGIIGVLGGFCALGIPCLIAVLAGHAALSDIKKQGKRGHGMAVAGLIMGYLFIAPAIIFVVTGGIGTLFS